MSDRPNKQLVVVIGIIEYHGRFLITRRVDKREVWHHKWQMPGGKIESGETPIDALRREIKEEVAMAVSDPQLLGVHTHLWELPEHTQQTFFMVYRVQALDDHVTLRAEESDLHQWVTIDEFFAIPDHLDGNVEMMRQLYKK